MARIGWACDAIAAQAPRPSKIRRLALPSAVVRSSKLGCAASLSGTLSTNRTRRPLPASPTARLAPTMPPPTMAMSIIALSHAP
jgi:hypothetical protein